MIEDRIIDSTGEIHCPICGHDKHSYVERPKSVISYDILEDGCIVSCSEILPPTFDYKCSNCEFEWLMYKTNMPQKWRGK